MRLGHGNGAVFSKWFVLLIGLVMLGCNSNSSNDEESLTYEPEASTPTELVVKDANNNPLAGAEVWVEETYTTAAVRTLAVGSGSVISDEEGKVTLPIPYGKSVVKIQKGALVTEANVSVEKENASSKMQMAAPVSCENDACEDISQSAVIGTLSGIVYDDDGVVENATVVLSNPETNGAFAQAVTDSEGAYILAYNVGIAHADTLKNDSHLKVIAEGYESYDEAFSVATENTSGVNIKLTAVQTAAESTVLWQETFEADSQTLAQWSVENSHLVSGWQHLEKGHGIENNLTAKKVKLASDDQSGGKIPEPAEGDYAYWYGGAANGNFVGDEAPCGTYYYADTNETTECMDGGTSLTANDGILTSPTIDLSGVDAEQPVSLTFQTWWEIESVNPNENGFDLMGVELSLDDGATWTTVARLNPLADPSSTLDRAPIPYSNRGFNKAPAWLKQEAIPLDGVQGIDTVKVRFVFETMDGLYNGFRGWMIDNVVLQASEGTFPVWEESYYEEDLFCSMYPDYCVDGIPDYTAYCTDNPEICSQTDVLATSDASTMASVKTLQTKKAPAVSSKRQLAPSFMIH